MSVESMWKSGKWSRNGFRTYGDRCTPKVCAISLIGKARLDQLDMRRNRVLLR
jgi:hypothetical protein